MDDERLIEVVRSFPCLWHVSEKSYRDHRARENAWKQVTETIGGGVKIENCMKRWKSIRDHFVRDLRKSTKCSGNPVPAFRSGWPLFDLLLFLVNTVQHGLSVSNFLQPAESRNEIVLETQTDFPLTSEVAGSTVQDLDASDMQSSSPPTTSRSSSPEPSKPPNKKKQTGDLDDTLLQLSTIALERQLSRDREAQKARNPETNYGIEVAERLNKMTAHDRSLAKLRIQQVLHEIEYPDD